MPRDHQIPLFLWIATAILVHLIWGGGAEHAATRIEETLDIGRLARSVRQHVRLTTQTLEISMADEAEPAAEQEPEPADSAPEQDGADPKEEQDASKDDPTPAEQAAEDPKPLPEPEPEKQKPEPPKPEEL